MKATVDRRPAPTEHAPYYAGYIGLTPDGNLVKTLTAQIADVEAVFRGMPADRAGYAYAPGKWTLREQLGHLIDTERVFCYRATAFSRADPGQLPGFDQDAWTPLGRYNERDITSVLDEWIAVRRATVAFAAALPDEAWDRTGIASGFPFTVRAAMWIIPGHVNHHFAKIREHYG